jgi:hypothetical protein
MNTMTRKLFFDPSGPYVVYEHASGGVLKISDLNPEINTRWSMTRWELFRFGLRCILASLHKK